MKQILTVLLFLSAVSFILLESVFAQSSGSGGAGMYEQSTYLTGITWDSQASKIECGDNSAATWSANDLLYGALGDCKSSFNMEEVGGSPYSFTKTLTNAKIDGQTWSCCGYGPDAGKGGKKKASGVLAIGNTIYILARNWDGRNGVAIAKSTDNSRTYCSNPSCSISSPPTLRVRLGHPVFVNYGKGYADGPSYVYIFGHGCDDTSYSGCGQMHMLRVPKDRIMDPTGYEVYNKQGIWQATDPNATDMFTKAGSVFDCKNTGQCDRAGMTYNAPLGRFLVWMSDWNGTDDFRNQGKGGFGIYESATPWDKNSWKKVWHTTTNNQGWNLDGIGDQGNFTTKWMSADGKKMYLVYGGTNSLTIRGATFLVNGNPPPITPAPTILTSATPQPTVVATFKPSATALSTLNPTPLDTPQNGYPPIDLNDDDLGLTIPTSLPSVSPTLNPTISPQTTATPRNTPRPTSLPTTPPTGSAGYFKGVVDGQQVTGTVSIEFVPNTAVNHVDFYLDGKLYNSEYIAPYNMGNFVNNQYKGLNTNSLAAGVHTITAKLSGGSEQSVRIQLGSTGGGSTGSGNFKGITSGQQVNGRVRISYAISSSGIKHVDFYVDGKLINAEYLSPYEMGEFSNNVPLGYNTDTLASGTHTLSVKIYRNTGKVDSDSLSFRK